jgi:hypothetical protein
MKKNHSGSVRLIEAAALYLARQARKAHPAGSFDGGRRWLPADTERCDCCRGIRRPSRAWPYSLMQHCRTSKHVAALFGVQEKELKQVAEALRGVLEWKDAPTMPEFSDTPERSFQHLDVTAA